VRVRLVNHRAFSRHSNKPNNIVQRPPPPPRTLPLSLQSSSARVHRCIGYRKTTRSNILAEAIAAPLAPVDHSTIVFRPTLAGRRGRPFQVCFLSATAQTVIGAKTGEATGSPAYRRQRRNEEITDEKLIPAGQAGAGGRASGRARGERWRAGH